MDRPNYQYQERTNQKNQPISYNNGKGGYEKFSKTKPILPGSQVWLNYKGVFNMEGLYKLMYEWLKKNGYQDIDGAKDKIEHMYYEKAGPDGMKGEVWIWWRTIKRSVDSPGNPGKGLVDYRINIEMQLLGLGKTAITVEGQKFGMHKGELSLFIKPYFDYKPDKEEWVGKRKGYLKKVMEFWRNRVGITLHDERKNELYGEFNSFYALVKQYLELQNYHGVTPEFHPTKGVPMHKL